MCHHRRTEYTRLYEDSEEREDLPEWALEEEEAAETDEEPFASGTAD